MKKSVLLIIISIFTLNFIKAQTDEYFLYGKIYTEDNDVYTGPIRWGKEEVYWSDMFNSSKERNPYLKFLSWEESEYLEDKNDTKISTIFGDIEINSNNSRHTHVFSMNFGDIKSLKPIFSDNIEIELKNGEILEMEGGSNDIGTKIKIIDEELGDVEIRWDRIEKVEFLKTPATLNSKFGNALYGKVETEEGIFEGFVQWDHDERVDSDKLDGDYKDGEVSIRFGKIKSIEKSGRGSDITLKSGKEIYLTGSNDVNYENKGIIVSIPGQGRVDISWESFEKVEFTDIPKNLPNTYSDYPSPRRLNAEIKLTNGDTHKGLIAFDLDEAWDFEMLNGKLDDIEFLIPFRDIENIRPKNSSYSIVKLKNGKEYLLGESQDVTDKNDGILLFLSKKDTKYFPWEKIEEIKFL